MQMRQRVRQLGWGHTFNLMPRLIASVWCGLSEQMRLLKPTYLRHSLAVGHTRGSIIFANLVSFPKRVWLARIERMVQRCVRFRVKRLWVWARREQSVG